MCVYNKWISLYGWFWIEKAILWWILFYAMFGWVKRKWGKFEIWIEEDRGILMMMKLRGIGNTDIIWFVPFTGDLVVLCIFHSKSLCSGIAPYCHCTTISVSFKSLFPKCKYLVWYKQYPGTFYTKPKSVDSPLIEHMMVAQFIYTVGAQKCQQTAILIQLNMYKSVIEFIRKLMIDWSVRNICLLVTAPICTRTTHALYQS